MSQIAPGTGGLEQEQIHYVLSNKRRKRTIERLKQADGKVELRSLAEWIAEAESGESPPPSNVRQSVYNSLHQTHLPTLDDLGIVDYDRNRKRIVLREGAKAVDIYMEVLTPYGISWGTYYRSLAVLGFLVIVADQLGALFLPGDYPVLIASGFLGLIVVSMLYQFWSNQWVYLRDLSVSE